MQLYAQRALPWPATRSRHPTPRSERSRRRSRSTRRPIRKRRSTPCWATCRTASPAWIASICGDVGYGKTEVALRATPLMAVLGGKQVAVLAPTTVLAEQALRDVLRSIRRFPRSGIAARSRGSGRSTKQQGTLQALTQRGKVDVVIGTHRLLSRDVRFRDLGLLIVDEEQRFGVTHKERLKELRTQVDVLTLTATPIPRTLQMAMGVAARDFHHRDAASRPALAIRTFVCRWDKDLLGDAVRRELSQRRADLLRAQPHREPGRMGAGKLRDISAEGTAHRRRARADGRGRAGEGQWSTSSTASTTSSAARRSSRRVSTSRARTR